MSEPTPLDTDLGRLDSDTVTYGVAAKDFQAMTYARAYLEADPAARDAVYEALRAKYNGNPEALETIDIHDPASEYSVKKLAYVDAIKSGDTKKIEELMLWFSRNYPISEARAKHP